MMHGYGFGAHMLIFWIFIIVLMVSIFRDSSSGKNKYSKQSETAIEILKKRYAKGEITSEEYQEIKQKL
ncbi:SHOCT domain-containing protein [Psychrilyobacter piezotolerans]|nr:SHOCT domain-containing protein [Psychrilyobacter piezotolerans]MCS5422903.1 SHOCT domain-containing protein [Psychrilyobacter sp. S5]